jgi:hypothetical protein
MIPCPRCQAPTYRADSGRVCSDCGAVMAEPERQPCDLLCPRCRQRLYPSNGGGYWCFHCKRWMSERDLAPYPKIPPYKDGRQAREAWFAALAQASTAPSALGPQLERFYVEAVAVESRLPKEAYIAVHPTRGNPRPLPTGYEVIGTLALAFAALHEEDRLIMIVDNSLPDYYDDARRCKACKHVYGPESWRCTDCGRVREVGVVMCTRQSCGKVGHFANFPRLCPNPECKSHHSRETKHTWEPVPIRAKQIGKAVTAWRLDKFETDHGRLPFDGEGASVGYCVKCGKWTKQSKCCSMPVRWGITVGRRSVAPMMAGVTKRWERELRKRRLIR